MTTNHLAPVIRFKDFTDAWEQRKLGEVINFLNGRAYKQKELLDTGKYRVLRVGNFNTNDRWYYSDLELDNNKYADKGDLLYLWATNFGPEIWNEERVIYHYHIWKLQFLSNEIDKLYLYTWLLTDKERIKLTTNGTTMVHVTKGGMEQRVFQYPKSIDEQTKIGSFFKQLDDTIALHQRELDLLKEQKKGFLQKMFPKKDEVVPEIRFKGFTDAWEQRKFSDCFNFPVSTNSLSRALLNYDEGDVKSVHYGDILIKYSTILNIKIDEIPYITDGKLEKYNSNLLKNGDLIFADAAEDETVGKAVEVSGITDENLVAGLHTIVARSKEKKAEFFLGYYINSDVYHRQLLRLMQGSKVSSISKGNLQKTIVSFPKNMEEQSQIGNFFKQLDDTIALHQCELEKLQEMKKAFLQKMFV
ncbi:restriction endonuclease subunit S [Vagococcus sp. CY52-2]|uniref:restriction endonuclease subunit S n=1 Tax=Vagococcus sp. CY52-2 TaxID=2925838 RepID=UPI001F594006|nr:restriction endonuclease subunit S [Vagococcus sp. CY52-2]UNM88950.1 restriction endonuclease subunit S [Vagococcus sp. CY52-2]